MSSLYNTYKDFISFTPLLFSFLMFYRYSTVKKVKKNPRNSWDSYLKCLSHILVDMAVLVLVLVLVLITKNLYINISLMHITTSFIHFDSCFRPVFLKFGYLFLIRAFHTVAHIFLGKLTHFVNLWCLYKFGRNDIYLVERSFEIYFLWWLKIP